jgi:hypothetical protein
MIRFNCHRCGMLMQAADTGAGRHAKCPGCGLILTVPQTAADVPEPPAPPQIAGPPAATPPPIGPSLPSPPVTALARQAVMPVPTAGMPPPPGAPLLNELLGAGRPPLPTDSAGPLADLVEESLASTSGQHKLHGSGEIKTVNNKPILSNAALRNLGIAALATGAVGIGLFWVPFAGAIVALFGLAAGLVALFAGTSRGDSPMGWTLSGVGISFVALALGAYWTYSSLNSPAKDRFAAAGHKPGGATITTNGKLAPSNAMAKSAEAAAPAAAGGDARDDRDPLKFAAGAYRRAQDNASKDSRTAAQRNSRDQRAARPQLIVGSDGSVGLAAAKTDEQTSDRDSSDKSGGVGDNGSKPADIKWAAAEKKEPQGTGPLQVTITKVVVGKVPTYAVGGLPTLVNLTQDSAMTIWFKIHNGDEAGSVEYTGWMGAKAEETKIESKLVDDHGRDHRRLRFPLDEAIPGSILGKVPLKPVVAGQSIADAVVFPVLPEDVDDFDLTLSGKAIGQEEDLHFRIPRSMIKPDDSNPLLGGTGN